MFETLDEPLAPFPKFAFRVFRSFCISIILMIFGLGIGMYGYEYFMPMDMASAFSNSALILADMGPPTTLPTDAGKVFIGFYALISGLLFASIIGIINAPIIHRFLHTFHQKSKAHENNH